MSELTIIVSKSYSQGMAWLRANHKRYNLDSQMCRVTTKAAIFKGLEGYNIIWLRGWAATTNSESIRREVEVARAKGRVKSEITT